MTKAIPIALRAVERDDLAFTRACRNDPAIYLPALGRKFPATDAGEEAWFQSLGQGTPPTEATFIIAAEEDGHPLGLTTLREIDWVNRNAMLGLWITPEAQGKGAGRSACEQLLAFAFDQLNLHRIALDVLASNERAISIYDDLGFSKEGRFRDESFAHGAYSDVVRMALLRTDFTAGTSAG